MLQTYTFNDHRLNTLFKRGNPWTPVIYGQDLTQNLIMFTLFYISRTADTCLEFAGNILYATRNAGIEATKILRKYK